VGCTKYDVITQIFRSNIIKMKSEDRWELEKNEKWITDFWSENSGIYSMKNIKMDVNQVACQDVAQADSSFGSFQMQWLSFRLHKDKDKDHVNDINLLTKTPWHMNVTSKHI